MNVRQTLKTYKREFVRSFQLQYARLATWIPERYPDFMCIGAPRAATTWLHTKLRADPQVFLPKMKELHFFDEERKGSPNDTSGLIWYRPFYFDMSNPAHFRWYGLQFSSAGVAVKGDITPDYSLLSAERVKLIHRKIPGLRIIYILRNPIERAWSGLRKSIWYQKGADEIAAKDPRWLARTIMHPEVLERGNYRHAIETWGSIFPETNMMILFYDDILANSAAVLAKVYAFLSLRQPAAGSPDIGSRVNAAPELPMPKEIRAKLEVYYRDQIFYLQTRFDRDLRHWMA